MEYSFIHAIKCFSELGIESHDPVHFFIILKVQQGSAEVVKAGLPECSRALVHQPPSCVQPKTWGSTAELEAGRGAVVCAWSWVPAALLETVISGKVICPPCHLLSCHPPAWLYNNNHDSEGTAAALLHSCRAEGVGSKRWHRGIGDAA